MRTLGVILLLAVAVLGVKREDFKRCDQAGFCGRARERLTNGAASAEMSKSAWLVNEKSVVFNGKEGILKFKLQNGKIVVDGEARMLEDGRIIRVRFDEDGRKDARYRVPEGDVISKDLSQADGWAEQKPEVEGHRVFVGGENLALHLGLKPFKLSLWENDELLLSLNDLGQFNIESEPIPAVGGDDLSLDESEGERDAYKQSLDTDVRWGRHIDSAKRGRQSLSLDLSFGPEARHIWGLPEHTAGLALKTTAKLTPHGGKHNVTFLDEPFRLYNLDVFEYELDSTMALYGAVPWVMSKRVGALWNNPSETWVDVVEAEDRAEKSTLVTSESGIIDLFLMAAKGGPKDLMTKLALVTGFPALPPLFSLGYHQCRWNYKSQQDLLQVHAAFDEAKMPVDVLWLDIEHTDGKKYFTWDPILFSDPVTMQKELEAKGRHLVTIVDPHIKVDQSYPVYQELSASKLAVLDANKNIFRGHCWPGDSVWTDFADPDARKWWADRFSYEKYAGSTSNLHIWNDMNEPSVFSGPEITMPKDCLHLKGTVEHRDLHNLYGAYMQRATFEGLRRRTPSERPFVLSRAFYAGSQKYGAVWTGDNAASWDHLAVSVPMLLGLSISGIPFAGADVGGFFGNPDAELQVRWYQTAALTPFFRGHAHIDSARREPYLLEEPYKSAVREALRLRYQLLPYLYTLMYEASVTGIPPLRPMFLEFPTVPGMESVEDQFMLGSALLHKPVAQAGEERLSLSLPAEKKWYDFVTLQPVDQDPFSERVSIPVELDTIPLYIASGSIIPLKMRQRRSSKAMLKDPFTLLVVFDNDAQSANGTVYIDDGISHDHELGAAHYQHISFSDGKLSCKPADSYAIGVKQMRQDVSTKVESIVMTGFKKQPTKASLLIQGTFSTAEKALELEFDSDSILRLRLPPVTLSSAWTIKFE